MTRWAGILGANGALLVALNVPWSGYAFPLFLASSLLWSWVGWRRRDPDLCGMNLVFTACNLLGVYRWLF